MATTESSERRELAHRAANGIDVRMFWSKPTNRVTIEAYDSRADEVIEFEVEPDAALEAFNHPYGYAATRRVRITTTSTTTGSPQSVRISTSG
jgi:hypothetical protein